MIVADPATRAITALNELHDALDCLRLQRDQFRARAFAAETERDTWRAKATTGMAP